MASICLRQSASDVAAELRADSCRRCETRQLSTASVMARARALAADVVDPAAAAKCVASESPLTCTQTIAIARAIRARPATRSGRRAPATMCRGRSCLPAMRLLITHLPGGANFDEYDLAPLDTECLRGVTSPRELVRYAVLTRRGRRGIPNPRPVRCQAPMRTGSCPTGPTIRRWRLGASLKSAPATGKPHVGKVSLTAAFRVERVTGIEPA